MHLSPEIVAQRMRTFEEECQRRRVKLTHQRIETYREVASSGGHPDAETIHNNLRKRLPRISLDTVYRNLKMLTRHGLISIVNMGQERLRFDASIQPHHHFVCVKCGLIRDFASQELPDLTAPSEATRFGEALSVHIEVRGVCEDCASEGRSAQPETKRPAAPEGGSQGRNWNE